VNALPLASDYPFLDVFWTLLVFFGWVIWFWLLITVFGDLFRRHDVSGVGKVGWCLFVILLPFLGTLIYLGTQGKQMAERNARQMQAAQTQMDDHVRSVATSGGPATEIENAKKLLDSGAISQEEFEALKRKALS
jgi:putative oligomerization/nucleic acid binding protein/phospholipase D-like protein